MNMLAKTLTNTNLYWLMHTTEFKKVVFVWRFMAQLPLLHVMIYRASL